MNKPISNKTIRRPDERLASLNWPDLKKVEVPSIGENDLLLVCAGFEDRAIETVRRCCELQESKFSLWLISYLPVEAGNSIEEMRSITRKAGLGVTEFVYDRENPPNMREKLQNFSQKFDRVFIDISGMSRLLIVQALVTLIRDINCPISVLYGEANEYLPFKEEFERDNQDINPAPPPSYLSSGIFEIAATPELGSVSMLGEAIRLVAFPSFDPSQLTNLVQELQPTYAEIIHGVPPDQNNKWRAQAIRHLNKRILKELRGGRSMKLLPLIIERR